VGAGAVWRRQAKESNLWNRRAWRRQVWRRQAEGSGGDRLRSQICRRRQTKKANLQEQECLEETGRGGKAVEAGWIWRRQAAAD
jgi:hypothetical protein